MFDCQLVYTFWQLITDNVATSLHNSSFLQHFENATKLMIRFFSVAVGRRVAVL